MRTSLLGQLAVQPCPRESPFIPSCLRRKLHRLRGLLNRQPAKIPQHDDSSLTRREPLERVQRLINCDDLQRVQSQDRRLVCERSGRSAAPAFQPLSFTCVIHANAPHRLRSRCKEMPTILKRLATEPQVCLVDEGCTLGSTPPGLLCEVCLRYRAQFGVDQAPKSLSSIRIAFIGCLEKLGNLAYFRVIRHRCSQSTRIHAGAHCIMPLTRGGCHFQDHRRQKCRSPKGKGTVSRAHSVGGRTPWRPFLPSPVVGLNRGPCRIPHQLRYRFAFPLPPGRRNNA